MTPERWILAALAVAVIANAVAGILGARANDRNIRRLLEANRFYREAIESLNDRFLDHRHGECERCKAPIVGNANTVRWTCVQCGFQATNVVAQGLYRDRNIEHYKAIVKAQSTARTAFGLGQLEELARAANPHPGILANSGIGRAIKKGRASQIEGPGA